MQLKVILTNANGTIIRFFIMIIKRTLPLPLQNSMFLLCKQVCKSLSFVIILLLLKALKFECENNQLIVLTKPYTIHFKFQAHAGSHCYLLAKLRKDKDLLVII